MSGSRQSSRQGGFTLVEILAALAVFGVLVAIGGYNFWGLIDVGKTREAILEINELQTLVDDFTMTRGSLPTSLADVGKAGAADPWDNAYVYQPIAGASPGTVRRDKNLKPINTSYDLYSIGKDGVSSANLNAAQSRDDIVRANDGAFVGLGQDY